MKSVTHFELAWRMYQAGVSVEEIGRAVERDRATVFRWLAGIKRYGIREFVHRKATCKRRRQLRKVNDRLRRDIIRLRRELGWCGQKIQKELWEKQGVKLSLMTVYRVLRHEFVIGSKWKRQAFRGEAPKATRPREVVQHDTVDFGELFAYTSIDIFTKEPMVIIADNLLSETGVAAFKQQRAHYGSVALHQSDEGPEFKGRFVATVHAAGAEHRYARPYKKNDQAYIENFNRSLRKECLGWGKYKREDKARVQARVNAYLRHFIHERWHMGLPNMVTPAQFSAWYNDQKKDLLPVAFAL